MNLSEHPREGQPSAAGHRLLYEFRGFRLDPQERVLFRGDVERIPIAPRAFEALRFLIEHPGELIDKATLMAAVWPNTVVEDNSLSQCISAVRRALGETAGAGRFIATIPGRGYQFVAPVQVRAPQRATSLPCSARTPDAEAYEWFLQGQSLCTRPSARNLHDAADLFGKAIERDADFARAYLGLAYTQHLRVVFHLAPPSAIVQCARNARMALAIDAGLAQGYVLLGAVNALAGKWSDARRDFDAALALERRDPQVVLPYVMNLLVSPGHLRRAREMLRESLESSPAYAGLAAALALVGVLLGRATEARRHVALAIALGWDKRVAPLSDAVSQLAVRAHRFQDASAVIVAGLPPAVASTGAAACIQRAFRAFGEPERRTSAALGLQTLESQLGPEDLDHSMRKRLMLWYTQLGALDAAFDVAQRSLDHYAGFGTVGTVWDLIWMPEMEAFRGDARFEPFAERLGLRAYWSRHGGPDAENVVRTPNGH